MTNAVLMLSILRPTLRNPVLSRGTRSHKHYFPSRAMAGVATKHEWLIILPDHDDALERRLKVRPEHLQNIKPKVDSDIVTFGGAILEDVPKEGEGLRMNGSVMLVNAASRDEAIGVLKDDVYFKNRVWDWDKVVIYPFKTALRKAL